LSDAIKSAGMTDARLFGMWESDPRDASAIGQYGRVRLHFFESGDLTYTICSDAVRPSHRLTYSVDADTITTQQRSSPREEQTKYAIEGYGRLAHTRDGIVSWYRRVI